jgi:hypothetical protein
MNSKKVKRKCMVRGCAKTKNVFAIGKSREIGGDIIMCTDCMVELGILAVELTKPVASEPVPEPMQETISEFDKLMENTKAVLIDMAKEKGIEVSEKAVKKEIVELILGTE